MRPLYKINEADKDLLAQTRVVLSSETLEHNREIYNLLDLLGDLGGVKEVIMIVFGFFLFPISEHSFINQATKRQFLVKTEDTELFAPLEADDVMYQKQLNAKTAVSKFQKLGLMKYTDPKKFPPDV